MAKPWTVKHGVLESILYYLVLLLQVEVDRVQVSQPLPLSLQVTTLPHAVLSCSRIVDSKELGVLKEC